jgi:Yip1 domain
MSESSDQNFQPPPPPQAVSQPPVPRPTNLRPPAIGLFVIGLLLVVTGIVGLVPGGALTGAAFAGWGLLLFGLSFIPLPSVESTEPPLSAGARVMGIFFEPSRVFKNLRAYPRWAVAFIIISILSVAYSAAFVQRLTPERIVNFTIDKVAESGFMPADRVEQAREIQLEQAKNPVRRVMSALSAVFVIFLKYSFAGALFMLGVLAFGGRINFWQSFSAVIYAALPWTIIQKVLSIVILYVKSPDDIHPILGQETQVQDNLGILFSPANHPALFVAGTTIGALSFYWLWLMARGLQFAGTKVSPSAAWGVTITLMVLAVGLGMIFATLFSGFMS